MTLFDTPLQEEI